MFLAALLPGCSETGGPAGDDATKARERMVRTQLKERDIRNADVLAAMEEVPRHLFVPENVRAEAYADRALPIGHGQTISQPYVVALMTEKLDPRPDDRVLEIGTGSGYQAAVLSGLVKEVYTIEIVVPLAHRAEAALKSLCCTNVTSKAGDGHQGWKEHAPFDGIIVTCAPDHVPEPLVAQLAEGGRMIIPVGDQDAVQELVLLRKEGTQLKREEVLPVRFVPMTGGNR